MAEALNKVKTTEYLMYIKLCVSKNLVGDTFFHCYDFVKSKLKAFSHFLGKSWRDFVPL